jgi:hypothetical protein
MVKSNGAHMTARQTAHARRVVLRWYFPSIQDMRNGTDTPANPVPALFEISKSGSNICPEAKGLLTYPHNSICKTFSTNKPVVH